VARFRINGLIVAARLPQTTFHLFDCTIEPTATPQSSPDARRPPLGFIPAAGIQFASVEALPPHIKVEARHTITTELDAESWDDARSISNERFGRCLSAIAFASDPLHHGMALITGWQELAVDGSVLQAGEAGTSIVFEPAIVGPFNDATEQGVRALEQLAARDPATRSLLGLWHDAERSNLLGFSNVDRQEALIRYAHVLEKIGDAMAPGLKRDTPDAIAAIAARVRDELVALGLGHEATEAGAAVAAEAIDRGRRDIQRLRLETIGQRIRSAGEGLGLDQRAREAARNAWEERNRLAGHPPEHPVDAGHLTNARAAAGSHLQAYLVWRSQRA